MKKKIGMRGTCVLVNTFNYALELINSKISRADLFEKALIYVDKNQYIDFVELQRMNLNKDESVLVAENITFEVEDTLYDRCVKRVKEFFPDTRITHPFVVRMILNAYISYLEEKIELEKRLIPNEEASYVTSSGKRMLKAVDGYGDERKKKAEEQSNRTPLSFSKVILHVNELMDKISGKCTSRIDYLELDGKQNIVIDNVIVAVGLEWQDPVYDKIAGYYTYYDHKYEKISKEFNSIDASDLIYVRFTKDGYIGVVGDSFDINFDMQTSSGKLLHHVNKEWNKDIVLIIPLPSTITNPNYYERKNIRKKIETALGEYLIEKGNPIIDFYSHNNFVEN